MFWIDVASRILHVSTAILLLGGSLFTVLALQPVLRNQTESVRNAIAGQLRGRWKRWVHLGIAVFLATGFYNYFRAMPLHKGDGLYHAIIGSKILIALVIFFLASVLVGRSQRFESWRQGSAWPIALLCVLGIIVVALSGFVKVSGSGMNLPVQ